VSPLAVAQEYPAKPIRVIVPFSPGSAMDVLVRLVTPRLHEAMGQPLIVDNRVGGGGRTGTEAGAKAVADGYTLLMTALGPLIHTPILYRQTQFDPVKDFAAISLLATGPLVIVVHPSIPARNVKELVDIAKKRPGQLNYGSTGVGSVNHLLGEMLNLYTGTNIVHVPYKGGGDAIANLLGGEVAMVMTGVPPVMALARSGKVRMIVTTGPKRMPSLPEVQTMAEAGLPNASFVIWYGLVAPEATPRNIIARLHREIVKAMAAPDLRERYAQQGVDPETNSPEQFAQIIRDDYARWTKIIRAANIKLD
jgi:tripartite-type tricarboxylate transporter receptor subunit TctC